MTCDSDGGELLFRCGVWLPSLAHFFGVTGMQETDSGVDGSRGSARGSRLVLSVLCVCVRRSVCPSPGLFWYQTPAERRETACMTLVNSMPALRPLFHGGSQRGAVLRDLSTINTWVDGDLSLLSATFVLFWGALTRDTVRSWRNPHPPFSCASSYGPSSMWPPSVPGPAPRSTGSQKPPWSAGDRCMCTSPRFQPLRSLTRWSQMERCNGTKTSPSLPWLVTASLGTTAPLGLWVLLLVAGLPGLGALLSAVGKLSALWCIPSCDWMLGTQQ